MPQVTIYLAQTEHRLILAWVIALLTHLLIIFVVQFESPRRPAIPPSMEVILVRQQATTIPAPNPDTLAQISQHNDDRSRGFTNSLPATLPTRTVPVVVASSKSFTRQPSVTSVKIPRPVVVEPPRSNPSAATLVSSGIEMAQLARETPSQPLSTARRLRSKYISANTHEYKYAAYMEAWRLKVERIGNFNYPHDARRQGIFGSLILDVAVNATGEVNKITIVRSSGHQLLDDAAINIVQLATPFAPFPTNISADTDILHITRTWQFREGSISSEP